MQRAIKRLVFALSLAPALYLVYLGFTNNLGVNPAEDAATRDRHVGVAVPGRDAGGHARCGGSRAGIASFSIAGCSVCSRSSTRSSTS